MNFMVNLLHRREWFISGLVNWNEVYEHKWCWTIEKAKNVTTPEIIEKIHEIVLDDRKVKVRELAEATGISIQSVVKILHHNLGMRKITDNWVPRLLIIDQKR